MKPTSEPAARAGQEQERDRFVFGDRGGRRQAGLLAGSARQAPGGMVFQVLNRGAGHMGLLEEDGDHATLAAVLITLLDAWRMRVCAYCIRKRTWPVFSP